MSFYTSLSGLKNAQMDLNTVSNNIANSQTNGFKKSRTEFADIVAGSSYTNPKMVQGMGASLESITQNFSIGPIEQTGSALDMAIDGEGFFTTKSAVTGDVMFTRNGSFSADENGFIKDGSGNRLQIVAAGGNPASGALVDAQLPSKNATGADFAGVTIAQDGTVNVSYSDGTNQTIGQVALANFTSPTGLKQLGSSNWAATGLSGTPTYGAPHAGAYGGILSGSLERSNVDITEELVNLISAQRDFQANAKAMDTATQLSQTVINLRS